MLALMHTMPANETSSSLSLLKRTKESPNQDQTLSGGEKTIFRLVSPPRWPHNVHPTLEQLEGWDLPGWSFRKTTHHVNCFIMDYMLMSGNNQRVRCPVSTVEI